MPKKKSRELIAETLLLLLQNTEMEKIDINDLTRAAGISRQTFYYYFQNKRDLICWILESDIQAASDAFRHSRNLWDYITTALKAMREKAVLYRSIVANEDRQRSYSGFFENGLLGCAGLAGINTSVDIINAELHDSLLFFTFGASGMMRNWVENGMQQEPEQLTATIMANMNGTLQSFFFAAPES